ncbi:Hypothetical Protein FCC1311_097402 [Hondaea fermentalgiana]|uniref:Uncharacterized protein n=1 Tax=Hondaea fermentalgiana TaxID=2315210 RepID=A0A2R5GRL4_9STRA|nr:Hypothetical Protein FCC1311_097402 [Hondaea fermentalgiana]|eukprot:GBG33517.1 Hypothetical Protein FCC1311_097402 [Hondaea fermentalgiana]
MGAMPRALALACYCLVVATLCADPARAAQADWAEVNVFLADVLVQENATLPNQDPTTAPLKDLEVASGTTVEAAGVSGDFTIGAVTCTQWAFAGALSLSSTAALATQIDTSLTLPDIAFTCTGTATWDSLVVNDGFTGPGTTTESGSSSFTIEATAADLALDLTWPLVPGRRSGVDPDRPGSLEVASCALNGNVAPASIVLSAPPVSSDLTTVVQVLAQGVLGHVLACDLLDDLAVEASAALDDLFTDLIDLADDSVPTNTDVTTAETELLAALTPDQEAVIVNFNQASIAKLTLQVANRVLGSAGSTSGNGTDIAINDYAESPITLNASGIASLQGPNALLNGTIDIGDEIQIAGLNTFSVFEAFNTIAGRPYSLASSFRLDTLEAGAAAAIQVVAAGAASASSRVQAASPLVINVDLFAFTLSDLAVNLTQAVAADEDFADNVTVNEMNNSPFSCVAPSIFRVEVASTEVDDLSELDQVTLSGFADAALETAQPALQELIDFVLLPTLASDLPALTRGLKPEIEDIFNEALLQLSSNECISTVSSIPASELVDFGSPSFAEVVNLLDETIHMVDDSTTGINQVLRELALTQSTDPGLITFNSSQFLNATLDLGNSGELNIVVSALRFYDVNTFTSAAFMQPVGTSPTRRATNAFTLGRGGLPVAIEADVRMFGTGGLEIEDEEDTVRIELEDLSVFVDADLNVLEQRFAALEAESVVSPFCLMSTLDFFGDDLAVGLRNLQVNFSAVAFDCFECSLTPSEKQNIASDILTGRGIVVQFAMDKLRSGQGEIALNRAVQDLSSFCDASLSRPSPELEPASDVGYTVLAYAGAAGSALTLLAILTVSCAGICCCCGCGERRSARVGATKELESPRLAQGAEETRSLAMRRSTSLSFRYGVVVLAIVSLALFASSAATDMAKVMVRVYQDGGETQVDIDGIYVLNMPSVISEFFDIGVPMLGVAVAIFSAIWPYAQIILVMFCFFAPMSVLGDLWRGRFLYVLSFFAKWVLVDQYLILILIVIFDIRLDEDDLGVFGLSGTSARFSFVPGWGYHGFLLGVLGLASTTLLVMHEHVRNTSPSRASAKRTGIPRPAVQFLRRKNKLHKHVFNPVVASGRQLQMKLGRTAYMFAMASAMACIGLIIVALFLPSVTFTYLGAGGKGLGVIESGRDRVSFAIADFIRTLQAQGTTKAEVAGGAFVQIFFLIAIIFIPILQQVLLIVSYAVPLTLRERRMIWFSIECLMFCCTLEVFAVAIIFAAINVGTFVPFVTEVICLKIDAFIQDFVVPVGLLDSNNDTCFSAEGTFEIGFALLAVASLLGIANVALMSGPNRLLIEEQEEVLEELCNGVSLEDARQAAGAAYESEVDCWFSMVRSHLKFLHSMGLVVVRSAPGRAKTSQAMVPSHEHSQGIIPIPEPVRGTNRTGKIPIPGAPEPGSSPSTRRAPGFGPPAPDFRPPSF